MEQFHAMADGRLAIDAAQVDMFSPALPIDEVAPERIESQPRALGSADVSCRLRGGQMRAQHSTGYRRR
jgi:hypothetical protein